MAASRGHWNDPRTLSQGPTEFRCSFRRNACASDEKSPRPSGRGLSFTQQLSLAAGLHGSSRSRALTGAGAKHVAGGDDLDPKLTVALVVRGGAGAAQRVEAVH